MYENFMQVGTKLIFFKNILIITATRDSLKADSKIPHLYAQKGYYSLLKYKKAANVLLTYN